MLLWTSSRRTPSELTGTGSLYIYIAAVCLFCKKHVPVTVFFCFPLFSCQSASLKRIRFVTSKPCVSFACFGSCSIARLLGFVKYQFRRSAMFGTFVRSRSTRLKRGLAYPRQQKCWSHAWERTIIPRRATLTWHRCVKADRSLIPRDQRLSCFRQLT